MNCAKCGKPLPMVRRRLEPGGEWVEVEWSQHKGKTEYPPGWFICGWPGCEPQEPSELRKALQNLTDLWEIMGFQASNSACLAARMDARKALAGDER